MFVEEGIGGDDGLLDRGGGDAEGSAAAPLPREKIVEAGSDQPRRHGNRGEEDGPQSDQNSEMRGKGLGRGFVRMS